MSLHESRDARIETALKEALNAATQSHEDGTLWQVGHDAFYKSSHSTLDEQLDAALNAACINDEDDEGYKAGWSVFHDNFQETSGLFGNIAEKVQSIPSFFKKKN